MKYTSPWREPECTECGPCCFVRQNTCADSEFWDWSLEFFHISAATHAYYMSAGQVNKKFVNNTFMTWYYAIVPFNKNKNKLCRTPLAKKNQWMQIYCRQVTELFVEFLKKPQMTLSDRQDTPWTVDRVTFGQRYKAGVPRENPCTHEENMQTSHRKISQVLQPQTGQLCRLKPRTFTYCKANHCTIY